MRLLWASNYSSQSGYSIQSRLFVPRIRDAGHDIRVFELSNGQRTVNVQDGIPILPVGLDPLGADMMLPHIERENVQVVISLIDAWGLNIDNMKQVNWFPCTPVDTFPVAPAVLHAVRHAKAAIAMSRYGERELKKQNIETFYMPHAIDPAIWHPIDKGRARDTIGIDRNNFFVSFVGVNDSNPSRKGIFEMLAAWQIFNNQYPDAILYLHTTKRGRLPLGVTQGVDIPKVMEMLQINPHSIRFADEYALATGFPAENMAIIAAAADVLLLPTRGEGFGIPVLEYAAVGTPSIVTDFAASTELCFDGWLLDHEPEWSWQNALVAKPSIAAIVEKLEVAQSERDNPRRRQRCIEAARDYHIDYVFAKYTVPVLNRIAEMVLDSVAIPA